MTLRDSMIRDLFDELQLLIRAMQDGSYEEEVIARQLCETALKALMEDGA